MAFTPYCYASSTASKYSFYISIPRPADVNSPFIGWIGKHPRSIMSLKNPYM